MRRSSKIIVAVLLSAGIVVAGFFVHTHLEEVRYQEELARKQAATEILSRFNLERPWLLPGIIVPEVSPPAIQFSFNGIDHSIEASVNPRIYFGATQANRTELWNNFWEENEHSSEASVTSAYYSFLTFEPQMDSAIESVIKQLRTIRDTHELDNDHYIELIVKYVQSIAYYTVDDDSTEVDYTPRLSIQVLAEGTGDCDETAMLLASLLHHEGYAVSLFLYNEEEHMALGLKVDGEGHKGTGYVYVETSGLAYVSEVPTTVADGTIAEAQPMVLSIGSPIANPQASFSASALADVARIIDVRDRALAAADQKFNLIESTPMSRSDFNRQRALYEACFVPMNRFIEVETDAAGSVDTRFMDRSQAIAWIDEYAWWE